VWDNSADNVNNPSNPPVRVRWGRESEDEMGSVTLRVVPVKARDLAKLNRAISSHRRSSLSRLTTRGAGSLRQRIIKRFDADGDGKLNAEERRKARQAFRR